CSEAIRRAISIPFLHIAEATAEVILEQNLRKVALLGTKFTMEKDFYRGILERDFGIEVFIPDEAGRQQVHDIIYGELVHGQIRNESRTVYQTIIRELAERGAEGVVLGCTEIPLLIGAGDVSIPVFDTTAIHAEKAVAWALKK
ncbi:amino acid racemase, partial [Arthrospira platensis SPKY1]|nr:amino acid racemase [Arthrospira platensis SPKY1]